MNDNKEGKVESRENGSDDKILVAILQGGGDEQEKHAAWQKIQKKYQSRIHGYIIKMIRNNELAEDITQEAMVKAFKYIKSFRKDAAFSTWIYRIAKNATIDLIRKRQRRNETYEYDDAQDVDGADDFQKRFDSQILILQRQELGGKIQEALSKIPDKQRQVLLLRDVQGFSYIEIAQRLGIHEGTVMSRLFYARQKLQKLLKGEADEVGILKSDEIARPRIEGEVIEDVPGVGVDQVEIQEAELRQDDNYLDFLTGLISALNAQAEQDEAVVEDVELKLRAAKKKLTELES